MKRCTSWITALSPSAHSRARRTTRSHLLQYSGWRWRETRSRGYRRAPMDWEEVCVCVGGVQLALPSPGTVAGVKVRVSWSLGFRDL